MKVHSASGLGILVFAAWISIPVFAATQIQPGTLKDLRPVGTTSKKVKHQQFDFMIDAAGHEYTCRSKLGENVKATQYVVGSPIQFAMNGQNGQVKNSEGKTAKCNIIRVAVPSGGLS
jgi:hypothetical protein